MAYQRGSLKKVHRKEGETWVLRFRVTNAEGKRVEHTLPIGLVREFPKDRDAWREVDRSRLGVRINDTPKNPVQHVETRSKSSYRAIIITPAHTLAILKSLSSPLHFALVLTCAATALRSSEILALRWSDILWGEGRIRISKRWAKGKDGETKTDASDGYVPLHPVLAGHLRTWQRQAPHAKAEDFVFPSIREQGRKPLYASSFVADYLRPAARQGGVHIEDGQGLDFTTCVTARATGL